jgi:hypothetical protein
MKPDKTIALGMIAFLCAMVFLAFAVNAVGQIRGTYNYTVPDELLDLFKWAVFSIGFGGGVSGAAAVITAWRAAGSKSIEQKDEDQK